jgi:hypothetical protein
MDNHIRTPEKRRSQNQAPQLYGPDKVAWDVLESILVTSIGQRAEYGGMIYMLRGNYHATDPVTQCEPNKVDVGLYKPNKGCPENSIPVAYYHTHPILQYAGMHAEYSTFSKDEDLELARSNKIDAYLGTLDGRFLKYDYKINKILPLGRLNNTAELSRDIKACRPS